MENPSVSDTRSDSYKLRYKVYCEEMGLSSPNACHDSKEIKDDIDKTAIVINYYRHDNCVATFRANILSDGSAGVFEDLYNVDSNISRDKQAVLTKLMVDKDHRLKYIKQPTLVFWGEKDSLTPASIAKRLISDIPNAEMVIYPNTGHIPMEEIPHIT